MRHLTRVLFLVAVLLMPAGAAAQEQGDAKYQLVLRGVPLAEALEVLVRETQIDLVYNSDLVTPVEVFCVTRDARAEVLLQCVLENTGLEYVRSLSGAYVLIPAVKQPSRLGTLAGAVVDADTGAPLPYANVFLADASTGTAANEAGYFTLAPLVSGPHRMLVTYVGYETTVDTVYIEPGQNHRVRIPMHSTDLAMRPVVVDGLEQRLPSRGLGSEELGPAALTGTTSFGTVDVARAAASLPGVSVQRPLADLHIQGGSAGSHVVLLDGAPVRDPVSLGRHLSAFSPLALGRMTVERAGFSVDRGSNLTGMLALEHDLSVAAPGELRLSLDPVALNARVATNFGQRGPVEGSAMLAARTSVWPLHREAYVDELFRTWHAADPLVTAGWIDEPVSPQSLDVLRQSPDVHFSDLHGAIRLRPASFQTLDASLYRARNQLGSILAALNRPDARETGTLFATDDRYDWTNWAASLRHNWLLGARTLVSTYARGSWHHSRYTYGTGLDAGVDVDSDGLAEAADRLIAGAADHVISDESNRIDEFTAGGALEHSVTSRSGVAAGLEVARVESRFRLGSPFISPFAYDIAAWHLSGHVKADLHAGFGTVIEPGLRVTYVPTRDATYLEPRLSIRHDRLQTPVGGIAVRVAGGLYRQFVNEYELTSSGSTSVVPFLFFWLPVGSSMAPPRAFHLAGDLMVTPDDRWTISLSLYHKWQPRLLVLDYDRLAMDGAADRSMVWLEQDGFVSEASGRAFGGDARVRYQSERFTATGGYALSRVDRTIPNRFEGRAMTVPWNVPHRVYGSARMEVASGLSLEVAARLSAGQTWVYRDAYYDYLLERQGADAFEPLALAAPDGEKLPVSSSLDAGVSYRAGLAGSTVELRLYVLNALDQQNVYERNAFGASGAMTPFSRSLPGRSLFVALLFAR